MAGFAWLAPSSHCAAAPQKKTASMPEAADAIGKRDSETRIAVDSDGILLTSAHYHAA
ncbi:MAG TPA: hypothetical protein VN361_08930 [Oxalicibacterium sp.]|nr:hypothetical protein [Oxalicibacterium sp.]